MTPSKTIVFFSDNTSAELLDEYGAWVTVRYKSGEVVDRPASQITDRFVVPA